MNQVKLTLLRILCGLALLQPSLALMANLGLIHTLIKLVLVTCVYLGWSIVFCVNTIEDILSKNVEGLLLRSVLIALGTIVLIHFQIEGRVADGRLVSALSYNLPIIIKYVIFYEVFRFIAKEGINRGHIWLFIFYIFPIIFLIDKSGLFLDFSRLSTGSSRAWTLGYGDGLMLLYFLVRKQFMGLRLTVLDIVSLVILFYIGSRTNMFLLGIVLLYDYVRNIRYKGVLLIVVTASLILSSETAKNIDIERFTVLLEDRNDDASYRERLHFNREGIKDILDNCIIGNYAGQLEVKGLTTQPSPRWGGYMHNVLSFVRQFGLVGLMALLLTVLVMLNWRHVQQYNAVIIYLVIVSVFSRSYVFPYLWIILGLWEGKRRIYR